MNDNPNPSPVVQNVIVSAYLGILFACTALAVASFILSGGTVSLTYADGLLSVGPLLWWLVVFILGALVLTLPLVAVAVAVGLVFDKSMQRHPGLWSLAAPIIVWILASVMISLIGWREDLGSLMDGIWSILSNTESLILLLAAMPSAVIFYWLSHRKDRTGSS